MDWKIISPSTSTSSMSSCLIEELRSSPVVSYPIVIYFSMLHRWWTSIWRILCRYSFFIWIRLRKVPLSIDAVFPNGRKTFEDNIGWLSLPLKYSIPFVKVSVYLAAFLLSGMAT
jgi:hypothetical protein